MNIGVIGLGGSGRIKYDEIFKMSIEESEERQQQEELLESFGLKPKTEYYQQNLYQTMVKMINLGQDIVDLRKSFEEVIFNIPTEPTIEQLKKQIKYSKNPLEVKRLNIKLNEMYKKRRNR